MHQNTYVLILWLQKKSVRGYEEVIRGEKGFTYEIRSLDAGVGLTDIRDPQDEFFAQVEYSLEPEEYVIRIDAGQNTLEDFNSRGFLNRLKLHKCRVPESDNMIGYFENDVIDDWTETMYARGYADGKTLEVEYIEDEDCKTLIKLISEQRELSQPAEKLLNSFNPPFLTGEQGDHYAEAWKPYSDTESTIDQPRDREKALQQVFDTAISLSEEILEKKQRTQD